MFKTKIEFKKDFKKRDIETYGRDIVDCHKAELYKV